MEFQSRQVRLGDLRLDNLNPRFIVAPNSDESSIIAYLLNHEDIVSLAKDIIKFGGLIPGERPIVTPDGPRYVVLEGNRRVCACKLLTDKNLIPPSFSSQIPIASEELKVALGHVEVDVVANRAIAQPLLYIRHLKGVKNWSTFSKDNFFARQFIDQKLSIDEIANETSTKASEVRKGIREFFLIRLAIDSPLWTHEEKKRLNLIELKPAPYLRALNAESPKFKASGAKLLKIEFDKDTLIPESTLNPAVFNKAIYLLAKESFWNPEFTTRSHFESIEELDRLISSLSENAYEEGKDSTQSNDDGSCAEVDRDSNHESHEGQGTESESRSSAPIASENSSSGDHVKESKEEEDRAKRPQAENFFHNLQWGGVNPSNPDHIGLVKLASEIQLLSKSGHYRKYPITTAMLLRALLEQALKYHLKKIGRWSNLGETKSGYDPMLRQIISLYNKNGNLKNFFVNRNLESAFKTTTSEDVIALLDTNIHNSQYASVTKDELERIASKGAFALINGILTLD